jgi:membrane protein
LQIFIIDPRLKKILSSIKYYAVGIYERFSTEHIMIHGASLAFGIMLCLIPWALLLFSAFGFFLSTEESMNVVEENIRQFILLPGYEEQIQRQIHYRLTDLVDYRQTAGIVGLVGVLWLSTFLFGTARTILNEIFKVNISYNLFVQKLRDFQVLLILGVLFILTLFGSTFIYLVQRLIFEKIEMLESTWLSGSLPVLVGFLFTWTMFLVLFRFLPYVRLSFDVLVVSATLSALLWEVAKYLFGLYITNFANFTRIYGALTILAGSALWLYYSSIVFLIGAIVGQLYRERKQMLRQS